MIISRSVAAVGSVIAIGIAFIYGFMVKWQNDVYIAKQYKCQLNILRADYYDIQDVSHCIKVALIEKNAIYKEILVKFNEKSENLRKSFRQLLINENNSIIEKESYYKPTIRNNTKLILETINKFDIEVIDFKHVEKVTLPKETALFIGSKLDEMIKHFDAAIKEIDLNMQDIDKWVGDTEGYIKLCEGAIVTISIGFVVGIAITHPESIPN